VIFPNNQRTGTTVIFTYNEKISRSDAAGAAIGWIGVVMWLT
jgi:hypothetical protein